MRPAYSLPTNRRTFLATSAAAAMSAVSLRAAPPSELHLATNTYPWTTFAKRDGKAFPLHTDESLQAIASTEIRGYEPIVQKAEEFDGLAARLKAHRLEMRSLYVNSDLHDEARAKTSIAGLMAVAARAAATGVKIIVTNPSPIRWGGTENKTDAQLRTQAASLNRLGEQLRSLGITLAYHNHDSELRLGAREFHHMLTATDPAHVKFCLDAHWVYRGCGDSQLALFDALEHYGSRIVELHLRQSTNGKWNEVFTAKGDIDYTRLADWLGKRGLQPHLVLEQAVENGSPSTLGVVEAHRLSRKNALETFAGLARAKD